MTSIFQFSWFFLLLSSNLSQGRPTECHEVFHHCEQVSNFSLLFQMRETSFGDLFEKQAHDVPHPSAWKAWHRSSHGSSQWVPGSGISQPVLPMWEALSAEHSLASCGVVLLEISNTHLCFLSESILTSSDEICHHRGSYSRKQWEYLELD